MPTVGYDSWKTNTPAESYRCRYTDYGGVCGESTEQYGGRLDGEDYCLPHLAAMLDSELPAYKSTNGTLSVNHETEAALDEAIFWADSTGRKYQILVRLVVDEEPSLPICKHSHGEWHGRPSRVSVDGIEEWLCIDCTNDAIRAGRRVA